MGNVKFIPWLLVLSLFVANCGGGPVNNEPEFKWVEYDAYSWSEYKIPISYGSVNKIQIDDEDRLYYYKDSGFYVSNNYGKNFSYYSFKDDFRPLSVKPFGKNYSLALIPDTLGYDEDGEIVAVPKNAIAFSDDLKNWEIVSGKYIMYDFVVDKQNQMLYIGRQHGTSTIDLTTGIKFHASFLDTGLDDQITSLAVGDNNMVYAATHDGVYKSSDFGESWSKAFSSEIHKDVDAVRTLIKKNDKIIGLGYRGQSELYNRDYDENHLHILNNPNDEWIHRWVTKINIKGDEAPLYAQSFKIDGFDNVLLSNHNGLFLSPVEGDAPFLFMGPYVDENEFPVTMDQFDNPVPYNMQMFSNGDVILWNGTYIWFGERNPDFTYPE